MSGSPTRKEIYESLELETLEAVREQIARLRAEGAPIPAALLGVATQLLKAAEVPQTTGKGAAPEDKVWHDMVSGLPEHLQENMVRILRDGGEAKE